MLKGGRFGDKVKFKFLLFIFIYSGGGGGSSCFSDLCSSNRKSMDDVNKLTVMTFPSSQCNSPLYIVNVFYAPADFCWQVSDNNIMHHMASDRILGTLYIQMQNILPLSN